MMLYFSRRKKLAELYQAWQKENNVQDCPQSVITFLHGRGLINECSAIEFLAEHEKKPSPCPYCKHTELETREVAGLHYVVCPKCNASGPPAETEERAIAKWNRRL